jgi:hypothetical protein
LKVRRDRDGRQIEIHIAEPLEPDPSPFEFEIAIGKLKGINCQVVIKFRQNCFKQEVAYYVLKSINICPEMLKLDIETTVTLLHPLVNKIWKEEKFPTDWKEGLIIKIPKEEIQQNVITG